MTYARFPQPRHLVRNRAGTDSGGGTVQLIDDRLETATRNYVAQQSMRIRDIESNFTEHTADGGKLAKPVKVIHTVKPVAPVRILPPKPTTPCKEWEGPRTKQGYGRSWNGTDEELAHRQEWKRHHGPIPRGMKVCHACDNPPCWEITHLWLGTQADNLADMKAKGRANRGCGGRPFKFTEDEMRRMAAEPGNSAALGRKYGLGHDTIARWRKIFARPA